MPSTTHLAQQFSEAHIRAVAAASAGMRDASLGSMRLSGNIEMLADAAVSSATPFLRAPLLHQLGRARRLHPYRGDASGSCPSCGVTSPCPTAQELQW